MVGEWMPVTTDFRIFRIADPDLIARGIDLYRRVFRISPSACTAAPRLLAGLAHQGGFVLGAQTHDTMIGLAYGFLGMSGRYREPHLYLQLIVVDPEHQNSGVGRAMMARIGALARSQGLRRVRWAFDPLDTRNGHFYLDVIGARGREFVRNMYGEDGRGPSHRVITEWDLTRRAAPWPRPHSAPPPGTPRADGPSVLLTVEPEPLGDPTNSAVCAHLERLIAHGYELVSCQRVAGRTVVRLSRAEDAAPPVPSLCAPELMAGSRSRG
jgi:predicted GNAT superfamily acetyltransferase